VERHKDCKHWRKWENCVTITSPYDVDAPQAQAVDGRAISQVSQLLPRAVTESSERPR
jgi:hypothetical protein